MWGNCSGEACSSKLNMCQHGGQCVDLVTKTECDCKETGYYGRHCELSGMHFIYASWFSACILRIHIIACSRLLERIPKERARGRKREGTFVPSPSPSRFSLGAWNRLSYHGIQYFCSVVKFPNKVFLAWFSFH